MFRIVGEADDACSQEFVSSGTFDFVGQSESHTGKSTRYDSGDVVEVRIVAKTLVNAWVCSVLLALRGYPSGRAWQSATP